MTFQGNSVRDNFKGQSSSFRILTNLKEECKQHRPIWWVYLK